MLEYIPSSLIARFMRLADVSEASVASINTILSKLISNIILCITRKFGVYINKHIKNVTNS